jgi:hypothetical protein
LGVFALSVGPQQHDRQPIAGLVAFYNEKVDLFLCGQRLERPKTHFFAPAGSPDTP